MPMVDRKKFTIFEAEDLSRARIQASVREAKAKAEAAAAPTDGSTDMSLAHLRMGRIIQVNLFIGSLQRLNPALIFELSTGDPTKFGIYKPDPTSVFGKAFICGMESGLNLGQAIGSGLMPEFSIIVNEDQTTPDGQKVKTFVKEIRGWRTVLAALYLDGCLTEAQIEATFKISQGRDSSNWQKRVHPAINITI